MIVIDAGSASGALTLRAAIAVGIMAVLLLVVLLRAVRARRLQERHAMPWLVPIIFMGLYSIWSRPINTIITDITGIYDPRVALLSGAILFLLVMCLSLTFVVSRLSAQVTRLSQDTALDRLEREHSVPELSAGPPACGD